MARGETLEQLVTKLRIATRHDPNPALSKNVQPLFEQTIRDTQERLYDQFDWPFLKVQRDKVLAAGQRYYDFPADMDLERIDQVDVRHGGVWYAVERGISLDHYSSIDSDADVRDDPVQRWDVRDTGTKEQVEVWPVPLTDDAPLRFSGIRKLKPLLAASDRADIDSQLIVLYAKAELSTGDDKQLALQQAANRLETLQGRVVKTRRNGFNIGGCPDEREDTRRYPRGPGIARIQP